MVTAGGSPGLGQARLILSRRRRHAQVHLTCMLTIHLLNMFGTNWQWHQLGHMQVCTSLQTDNHASTPPLNITGIQYFLIGEKAVGLCNGRTFQQYDTVEYNNNYHHHHIY